MVPKAWLFLLLLGSHWLCDSLTLLTGQTTQFSSDGRQASDLVEARITPSVRRTKEFVTNLDFESVQEPGIRYTHSLRVFAPYMECQTGILGYTAAITQVITTIVELTQNFVNKDLREQTLDVIRSLLEGFESASANITSNQPFDPSFPGEDAAIQFVRDNANATGPLLMRRLLQTSGSFVFGKYNATPRVTDDLAACAARLPPNLNQTVGSAYVCPLASCIINLGAGSSFPQTALDTCRQDQSLTQPGAQVALSECVYSLVCRVSTQCAPSLYRKIVDYLDQGGGINTGKVKDSRIATFKRKWKTCPVTAIDYLLTLNSDVRKFTRNQLNATLADTSCMANVQGELENKNRLVTSTYKLQDLIFFRKFFKDSNTVLASISQFYNQTLIQLNNISNLTLAAGEQLTDEIDTVNLVRNSNQVLLGAATEQANALSQIQELNRQFLLNNNATVQDLFQQAQNILPAYLGLARYIELQQTMMQKESDLSQVPISAMYEKSSQTLQIWQSLIRVLQDVQDKTQVITAVISGVDLELKRAAERSMFPFVKDRGASPSALTNDQRYKPLEPMAFTYESSPGVITRKTLMVRCDALWFARGLDSRDDLQTMINMFGPNQCQSLLDDQPTIYTRFNISQNQLVCRCWGRVVTQVSDDADVLRLFRNGNQESNQTLRAQVLVMPPFEADQLVANGTQLFNITSVRNVYTSSDLLSTIQFDVCKFNSSVLYNGTYLNSRFNATGNNSIFQYGGAGVFNASHDYVVMQMRAKGQRDATNIFMAPDPSDRDVYCRAGIENLQTWFLPSALQATLVGVPLPFWTYTKMKSNMPQFLLLAKQVEHMSLGRLPVPMTFDSEVASYYPPVYMPTNQPDYVTLGNLTNQNFPNPPSGSTIPQSNQQTIAFKNMIAKLLTVSPNMIPINRIYGCRIVKNVRGLTTVRNGTDVLSIKPSVTQVDVFDAMFEVIPSSMDLLGYLNCLNQKCYVKPDIIDPITNMIVAGTAYSDAPSQIGAFETLEEDLTEEEVDGKKRFLYDVPQESISIERAFLQRANGVTCVFYPSDPFVTAGAPLAGTPPDPRQDGVLYQRPMVSFDQFEQFNIGTFDPSKCAHNAHSYIQNIVPGDNSTDSLTPDMVSAEFLPASADFHCEDVRHNPGGICSILDHHILVFDPDQPQIIRFYPRTWYYKVQTSISLFTETNASVGINTTALRIIPPSSTPEGRLRLGCPETMEIVSRSGSGLDINVMYTSIPLVTQYIVVQATACPNGEGAVLKNISADVLRPYQTTTIPIKGCANQVVRITVLAMAEDELAPRNITCLVSAAKPQLVGVSTIEQYARQLWIVEEDRTEQLMLSLGAAASRVRSIGFFLSERVLRESLTETVANWANDTDQMIDDAIAELEGLKQQALNQSTNSLAERDAMQIFLDQKRAELDELTFVSVQGSNSTLNSTFNQAQLQQLRDLKAAEPGLIEPFLVFNDLAGEIAQNLSVATFVFNSTDTFNVSNLNYFAVMLDKLDWDCPATWNAFTLSQLKKRAARFICDKTAWDSVFRCRNGEDIAVRYFLYMFIVFMLVRCVTFVFAYLSYCSTSQDVDNPWNKVLWAPATSSCPNGGIVLAQAIIILSIYSISIPVLAVYG